MSKIDKIKIGSTSYEISPKSVYTSSKEIRDTENTDTYYFPFIDSEGGDGDKEVSYSETTAFNADKNSLRIVGATSTTPNGTNSTSVGYSSKSEGDGACAYGTSAIAKGEEAVAFGHSAGGLGEESVAVGHRSATSVPNVVSFDSPEVNRIVWLKDPSNLFFRNEDLVWDKTTLDSFGSGKTFQDYLDEKADTASLPTLTIDGTMLTITYPSNS